ncbi:glycosyltransferase [Chryseobacterium potabilaquae]|nr:glycosyltransferase [Chryseobacterium potabilaquae]
MILYSIVSFREDYKESVVYKNLTRSFINSQEINKKLHLFIYDNTDALEWKLNADDETNADIHIYYIHNPDNVGISRAYNVIADFAQNNTFDHIVFLDQDTYLPLNFYSVYEKFSSLEKDISVPLIYGGEKLISPSRYRLYRSFLYDEITDSYITTRGNSCINSGIMVRTDFFHKVGGYNSKLRLDFCDHEFMGRVKYFTKNLHIIPIKLKQDFSTNTNSKDKALFRYSLFMKDIKIFKQIKNRFLVTLFVDLPHLLRLSLQYKSFAFLRRRLF